ncbi:hypothetical protein HMPREF1624_05332 [Sporothrix schenckii ATCC 58251]|uniref:PPM-type phosphatase domain-containing protein n=1 Tax=Sporothrix schenckii (strain ATCC 58251 / de Perez 2211183) TaxID=1391915 RepID=U7PSH3_SPOS1|nr:hypothetical protein HMPREF1624_05332 [Sporothrix schenckii ATCC 58251]
MVFFTTTRRSVTTRVQLKASTSWITYATVAGAASVPAAWWILSKNEPSKTLSAPDLDSDPAHVGTLRGPSPEEVTGILHQGAFTVRVGATVPGVTRYDGMQLASNSQSEDYYTHGTFSLPRSQTKGRWAAWAVLDGHAGWQTAELLSRALVPGVRDSLNDAAAAESRTSVFMNQAVVQQAITKAFVDLDNRIIKTAAEMAQLPDDSIHASRSLRFADKIQTLMPAWAGSCALLSLYDPATRNLHVACTGDSRAVLGRLQASKDKGEDRWEAVSLSVDQAGTNPDEVARLHAEHPDEEDTLVKDGRVLGIMVSRAFGDCRWKWPMVLQESLYQRYMGAAPLRPPKYQVKTPPYLTAEPVVTSTKLEAGAPYFMILASDGLWDRLSSQQAVDLVAAWLAGPDPATTPSKRRVRLSRAFHASYTTARDGNAAVHLVRNALGGRDEASLAARLAYGPPFSREVRDDITVQVVFFNMDGKSLPNA